jgi:hypothetical protein
MIYDPKLVRGIRKGCLIMFFFWITVLCFIQTLIRS